MTNTATFNTSNLFLASHAKCIALAGSSGNGKTLFTSILGTPEAAFVLENGVGEVNSTITPRTVVFTDDPFHTNRMTVAVRLKKVPFSTIQLTQLLVPALAETARSTARRKDSNVDEVFREKLEETLATKNNLRGTLFLLSKEELNHVKKELAGWISTVDFKSMIPAIYGRAEATLQSFGEKTAQNSAKLLTELKREVEATIDQMEETDASKINPLVKLRTWITDQLSARFFSVFPEDQISSDGYFFRSISLPLLPESDDADFVDFFFSNNSLDNGSLSLEVICEEIVIYCPIEPEVAKLLNNPKFNDVFTDSRGYLSISVLDTQGLFHASSTEDESREYCNDLIYTPKADAVILLAPLFGDSNSKKALAQYRTVMSSYRKDIPIIPIFNKADLFLDDLKKQSSPRGLRRKASSTLSDTELEQALIERGKSLFHDMLPGARPKQLHAPRICYLLGADSFPESLQDKYDVAGALEYVFDIVAHSLQQNSKKVPFHLDADDPSIVIDMDELRIAIDRHIHSALAAKKVYTPSAININENRYLVPNGNSYYALRRRLVHGEGYNCSISESYFRNCHSFSVSFPKNLQSFLSPDTRETLLNLIEVQGGSFPTAEDEAMFHTKVNQFLFSADFCVRILYDRALCDSEYRPGSFKTLFQNFIKESERYVTMSASTDEMCVVYAEVLSELLQKAAHKALMSCVRYV